MIRDSVTTRVDASIRLPIDEKGPGEDGASDEGTSGAEEFVAVCSIGAAVGCGEEKRGGAASGAGKMRQGSACGQRRVHSRRWGRRRRRAGHLDQVIED